MLSKLLILTLIINLIYAFDDRSSLYNDEGHGVIQLHAGNINKLLNNSPTIYIINFYASWCGHCISFSRIFKKYQKQIQNWGVYVAAINCAHVDNSEICKNQFLIYSYPRILLFNCSSNDSVPTGVEIGEFTKSRNVNSLLMVTGSFIMNRTQCTTQTHSARQFEPEFWDQFKAGNNAYDHVVIVISPVGEWGVVDSLSLDLQTCNRIFVTHIDITQVDQVARFGSFTKPTVIAVDRNINIRLLSNNPVLYVDVRREVYSYFKQNCPTLEFMKSLFALDVTENPIGVQNLKTTNDMEIYMDDLIKGIGMTLREEIPRKPLTQSETSIVNTWIDTLRECMHFTQVQIDFLQGTKQWLLSQGDVLSISDWDAFMKSDEAIAAFPTDLRWKTCLGSTSAYRGFPCSLWLIFHVMTVKCENSSRILHLNSKDVLLNARSYIITFFGCTACREHFKELTRSVGKDVGNGEDGILFLWNGHNYVNARLRLDDSADPSEPKIQFPSDTMCPECRQINKLNISQLYTSRPGYDLSPILWNRESILNFLRNHYGSQNIRIISIGEPRSPDGDLYDPSIEFIDSIEGKRK